MRSRMMSGFSGFKTWPCTSTPTSGTIQIFSYGPGVVPSGRAVLSLGARGMSVGMYRLLVRPVGWAALFRETNLGGGVARVFLECKLSGLFWDGGDYSLVPTFRSISFFLIGLSLKN